MKDICKRTTDIILALGCLIVLSPLMLFIYCSIRIAGSAIYRQERIGKGGKPFLIYKFRSMKVNAEENGIELLQKENDPRITRIGRILRKHHLDELPQLINVLLGDMSFVGYRPERKHYIDQIMQHDPRYEQLYQIRPGITSYATLYNGYTDTMEKMLKRLEMDLEYLKHRSWWEDIKIICLTVFFVATGKNKHNNKGRCAFE